MLLGKQDFQMVAGCFGLNRNKYLRWWFFNRQVRVVRTLSQKRKGEGHIK